MTLALPNPFTLVVAVEGVTALRAVPLDALTCLAFGTDRVIGQGAQFTVGSAVVDTLDVEVWDAGASRKIGAGVCSTLSRVLSGEVWRLDEEVTLALPGRLPIGKVRLLVERRAYQLVSEADVDE